MAQLATIGSIIGKSVLGISAITGLSTPVILASLATSAATPYLY